MSDVYNTHEVPFLLVCFKVLHHSKGFPSLHCVLQFQQIGNGIEVKFRCPMRAKGLQSLEALFRALPMKFIQRSDAVRTMCNICVIVLRLLIEF